MVGQIANGIDESGVVPEMELSEFLEFQVVERTSVLVDDGEIVVDAAEKGVVRQYLFHTQM